MYYEENKCYERGLVLPVILSSAWQHHAVPAVAMYGHQNPVQFIFGMSFIHIPKMWMHAIMYLSSLVFFRVFCQTIVVDACRYECGS
jgi:hypothetical protein